MNYLAKPRRTKKELNKFKPRTLSETIPQREACGVVTYWDIFYSGGVAHWGCHRKKFTAICRELNQLIADKLVAGHIVDLPKLGTLFIREGTVHDFVINWDKTHKLWEKHPELFGKQFIRHLNDHTDGKIFKLAWSRIGGKTLLLDAFNFKPINGIKKRMFKRILKEGACYPARTSRSINEKV